MKWPSRVADSDKKLVESSREPGAAEDVPPVEAPLGRVKCLLSLLSAIL